MTGQFSKGVLDRARGLIRDLRVDGVDLRLTPLQQADVFIPRYASLVTARVERMSAPNREAILKGTNIIGRRELASLDSHGKESQDELDCVAAATLIAAMIEVIYQGQQITSRLEDYTPGHPGMERFGNHIDEL